MYLDRLRIHKELPSEHTASTSRGEKCSAYKPQIGIGMTREQAKAAWCEPFEINTTETVSGVCEQWVSTCIAVPSSIFEDGLLIAIQR